MQYQSFLIKYAEIGTKGKNRYMFEDALIKQIRYALRDVDGHFEVTIFKQTPVQLTSNRHNRRNRK